MYGGVAGVPGFRGPYADDLQLIEHDGHNPFAADRT
jgi:hypothetical protein